MSFLKKYRYKIIIEYSGAKYCGWQFQESRPTVQSALEQSILSLTGECTIGLYGAGRTDAGVHALGQVAHFDLVKFWPSFQLLSGINHFLRIKNEDIVILSCEEVNCDFHARFSAKQRSYRYKIVNRAAPLVIDYGFAWHVGLVLNVDDMNKAAQALVGEHDFSGFRSSSCQSQSAVRRLDNIVVWSEAVLNGSDSKNNIEDNKVNASVIYLDIAASSFLHNQVRIIVGSLVEVGFGRRDISYLKKVLLAKDRALAGATAPASGLYFKSVLY